MNAEPGCIFCQIVRGQVPAAKVLETDEAMAFLDIHPVNPGHVLIMPKAHYATLSDLPAELSAAVAALFPRLCRAVRRATGATGLNMVLNHGRVAGQTVDHVHWHILPRDQDDQLHWPWPHNSYVGDEMKRMQGMVAAALAAPAQDEP